MDRHGDGTQRKSLVSLLGFDMGGGLQSGESLLGTQTGRKFL